MIQLILLILGLHALESNMNVMTAVAIQRTSFEPLTQVRSAFASTLDHKSQLILANFTLDTHEPTVRIANFPQINVTCEQTMLTFRFPTAQEAQEAYQVWSTKSAMNFILSPSHCYPQVTTWKVDTIHPVPSSEMKINAHIIPSDQLINSWELDMKQVQMNKQFVTMNKGMNISFDWNHKNDSQASKPMIILGERFFEIKDCWTKGSVYFQFYFKGSMFKLEDYRVNLNGLIQGNFDFAISLIPNMEFNVPFEFELGRLPLTTLQIPGLFSISPELTVGTMIHYETDINTALNLGFDFTMPIQLNLEKNPNQRQQQPPTTLHPHFALPKAKDMVPKHIGLAAHLGTGLALPIRLLNRDLASLSVKIDNAVGINFDNVNKTDCNLDMSLYRKHGASFRASVGETLLIWPLWSSPKFPLACPFCKTCPK